MGLFDAIEQLNTAEEQPSTPRPRVQCLPRPANATTPPQKEPPRDHQKPDADGQNTWQPSPAEIKEHRRILNRNPERLFFLVPCPVCLGRAFLHIEGGGFVCRTCQPGLFGYPVEAAGPDRQAPAVNSELLPAGDNNDVATLPQPAGNQRTEEELAYFAAAWPWIKENKGALLAGGWTMEALVRRSKYRWPVGPWGVAWLPVWIHAGLVVAIGRRGAISFTFCSSGRTITQTAYPPISGRLKNPTNS